MSSLLSCDNLMSYSHVMFSFFFLKIKCYTQWGALVKADQMIKDYNLVIPAVYDISMRTSFKRGSEVVDEQGLIVGSGGQIRRHSMYY